MTQPPASEFEYTAPPSFGQQRLWLLDQMLPDKAVYIESHVERLIGPLDVAAFERAIDAIVARHDILRTGYAIVDDELRQRVRKVALPVFAFDDLSALPPAERERTARRLMQHDLTRAFDLDRGDVFRVRLLRIARDEHWLVQARHHIVFDRWSSTVLERELNALYAAFARGEASPLPALPAQYADYARWQREQLDDDALERLFGYWSSALADLTALDLPTDRVRPNVATFRGARVGMEIDAELARALAGLARREGVTLFMLLMAAFEVLLHRYSGQEHFAVGTVVAGRDRLELEPLVGFFINTLVIRADLAGDPSFRAHLARVRQTLIGAYAHAALPFERLVERLAPSRDLSRNPLYQVAFRYSSFPAETLGLPGIVAEPFDSPGAPTAKFDLSISVDKRGDRLGIDAEFAVDLFDVATIERMLAHFHALLREIVVDPERRVSALPMLDAVERSQMLVDWNDTAVARPGEAAITRDFEEQVARTPHATAVECGREILSYTELNRRANRLAHWLRARDVGPEIPVAVAMERSIDWVVAMLAIWKAGGAYVPLDPAYPGPRLAALLADAGARVLLTQLHLADKLPETSATTLVVDADSAVGTLPDHDLPVTAAGATLAYLIHTSGSAGRPKGVMIEQRSLVNHLLAMRKRFRPDAADCVLVTSAIGFDQSIWQVLFPLISGARVALPESDGRQSPDDVVADIRRHRVTILRIVPTLLAALVDGPGLRTCATLRLAICAGEALERSLARAFAAQCGAQLVNACGPTEATFVSLLWDYRDDAEGSGLPIGRPIDNVRAYVLDRVDQPVPIGVYGELCIAGAGVGRGYCGLADSSQAFVADPFGTDPTARMYRTGDIVRYRADGNIEFLGRRDGQVKIRGVRVELGEIEATLATRPEIKACVVERWRDAGGDDRLVAYCVARDGHSVDPAELRAFLRATLPSYMVPLHYVGLDSLPLTLSGKVHRQALPVPTRDQESASRHVSRRPRNAVEDRIATIFAEVLRRDEVDVDQNFFDLGGHSLLAMQALSRIEHHLGVAISLRDFFSGPDVASLARHPRVLAGDPARAHNDPP